MTSVIGIVGSGIAGLTAGRELSRCGARVILLESRSAAGMDAHAVDIVTRAGRVRADIPSRMFNRQLWPELTQLYEQTGIQSGPVNASQSFGVLGDTTWMSADEAWSPSAALFLSKSRTGRRVARDVKRLMREGRRQLDHGLDREISLGDYLNQHEYCDEFVYQFLYPTLSSTVCTCSYAALDEYPACIVLEALRMITDGRRLLKTRLGTADVVGRMCADIDQIELNSHVRRIESGHDQVLIHFDQKESLAVDHVVIAAQANHALEILDDCAFSEQAILGEIRYEPVQVVVHRDSDWMPSTPRHWKSFNMIARADNSAAICTVWLNRFHDDWPAAAEPVFQSIWAGRENDFQIDSAQLIQRVEFQRPVVNMASLAASRALESLHAEVDRRIWFCGSWVSAGLPLLESGVASARRLIGSLGTRIDRDTTECAGERSRMR